ncbi:unnamed protein product [Rotaria socialis]|uniref:Uncharacterized protein n=1 Tax=Rotaria socialis TaxID=392032 RepID=A0A821P1S8_9BILA|nr:unnamed protein product [Rotaria socialis]
MLKRKTAAEYFERNMNTCFEKIRNFNLSNFLPQSTSLLEIYENYQQSYGFNTLTLFLTSLIGFGHFANNSSTYSYETNSRTRTSLFLVLVGPSASKKSRYIQKIYDSARMAEKILLRQKDEIEQIDLATFSLKLTSQKTIDNLSTPLTDEIMQKITFIEQSLSYPEAMRSLTKSNIFFCAPEGDYILDQLNFFDCVKENVVMRGCASALFDGQTITRSNYHGRVVIEDKTLSICVGSTGAKWSNILLHLHDNLITDGFHPRFLLHCAEPATTSEGKGYQLDRAKPSLIHLYVTRGIIGSRLQVFSSEASEYIQPYLAALDTNESHPDIKYRATSSYEQVVERRGAELIIRLASNIQYQKDVVNVLSQIEQLDFYSYDQNFIDQVKLIVEKMYGPPTVSSNDLTTMINNSKMIITKQTCEEAVHLYIDLLMPQHFLLMNYNANADSNETPTELKYQTEILKLQYRFFYKTTLFGNQGVLKNIHKDQVEYLLNRLVRRGILKKGTFLKSLKQNCTYESYLKYLPLNAFEENHLIRELKKHQINFDKYREIYTTSIMSPDGTILTADGQLAIQKQNANFMMLNICEESNHSQGTSNSIQSDMCDNDHNDNASSLANIFDEVLTSTIDFKANEFTSKPLDPSADKVCDVFTSSSNNDRRSQPQLSSLPTNNLENLTINQQQLSQINTNESSNVLEQQQQQQLLQTNTNESSNVLEQQQRLFQTDTDASGDFLEQQQLLTTNTDVSNNLFEQQQQPELQIIQSITTQPQQEQSNIDCNEQKEMFNIAYDIDIDLISNSEVSYMETASEPCQLTLPNQLPSHCSVSMEQCISTNSSANESHNSPSMNANDSSRSVHLAYLQFKESVRSTSTPTEVIGNVADPAPISSTQLNVSNSKMVNLIINPVEALNNPKVIPTRLLNKCKQMLLSKSPILTKTCWNRRFGGDIDLCLSATKLLMAADLLQEGNFAASSTNTFVSWIKKLPSDPANIVETLEFQQKKLNIFNVTWTEYASSFKDNVFNHSNRSSLISTNAAEILRSKPFRDVGLILNESNIAMKTSKSINQTINEIMNKSSDVSEKIILISPNGSTDTNLETANQNNSRSDSHISGAGSNADSATVSTVTEPMRSNMSSSIELHGISSNTTSGTYCLPDFSILGVMQQWNSKHS